jgi:phosphoribosylanthranilate isomerase
VCGLTRPEELARLAALGVDLAGVRVRARSASPTEDQSLARARWIARVPRGRTRLVAVTLDSRLDDLCHVVATLRPEAIQLHGFELPACTAALKRTFPAVDVLKVLHLAGGRCLEEGLVARYVAAGVDGFVLDAFASPARPGSTGQALDLDVVERLVPQLAGVPFLLAGGLRAASVASVRRLGPVGIDVDTAAREGGRLDESEVRALLRACRTRDAGAPPRRAARAAS